MIPVLKFKKISYQMQKNYKKQIFTVLIIRYHELLMMQMCDMTCALCHITNIEGGVYR